jgi:signal transduction histidine kinase
VRGRFADVDARLVELDRGLRELSQSLESTSALERPLERVLEREVASFRRRAGIEAELRISGSTDGLTRSQKLVVFRAVQEALSNAREHSGAERVEVSVESRREGVRMRVTDDGGGFDVSRTLIEAARRGRLGVVGISERVRLLGGTFDIDSRPGGPTSIELMLPRWEPLRATAGAVGGAQTS